MNCALSVVQYEIERDKAYMKPVIEPYPGQFSITPDLMHVVIPRMEIVAEMAVRGENEALNDVCLAVAVVADAIARSQTEH